MLVVSIIGVSAAVAAPRYANALANYRASAAADRVKAEILRAVQLAKAGSRSYTVTFPAGRNAMAIVRTSELGDTARTTVIELGVDPYLARIKNADFNGDTALVFSGFGIPDSGGQVELASGNAAYTVTVAAGTGAVTVARAP